MGTKHLCSTHRVYHCNGLSAVPRHLLITLFINYFEKPSNSPTWTGSKPSPGSDSAMCGGMKRGAREMAVGGGERGSHLHGNFHGHILCVLHRCVLRMGYRSYPILRRPLLLMQFWQCTDAADFRTTRIRKDF